jgi:hypothetical protein
MMADEPMIVYLVRWMGTGSKAFGCCVLPWLDQLSQVPAGRCTPAGDGLARAIEAAGWAV